MNQKYLFENTDYLKPTANIATNSSLIGSKNKQCKTHSIISIFTLLLQFLLADSLAAKTTIIFTSSSTWTCPAGVTSITVEAWGAGGGGTIGAAPKG